MPHMKKEVIFAVVLGVSLGFIITFGIWKARTALEALPIPSPSLAQKLTPTPTGSATNSSKISLEIFEPKNNDLINTEKVTLTGRTSPKTAVVIADEQNESTLLSDANGNFSQEITLIGGENRVRVFAFDENGNEATFELTLVYTTAEI